MCYSPGQKRTLCRRTLRKAECSDPRQPCKIADLLTLERVIFTRRPERAIVGRIDIQSGIIAPSPAERLLNARAIDQRCFGSKGTMGVRREPPGIPHSRRLFVSNEVI